MNAAQSQVFSKKLTPFHIQVKSLAPDRYAITVTVNNTEITTISRLPFSKIELREYQTLLGQANVATKTRESQYRIKQLSQGLFDFLIGEQVEVNALYNDARKKNDERLLISVAVENSKWLGMLPWELMCDADGDYLALSQRTPVIRSFPGNHVFQPVPVKLPLKVLVVITSPPNYSSLDSNQVWTQLNESVDDLQLSGSLYLERLSPPNWATLRRQIRTCDYNIIHFISPIYFDETTAEVSIAMEDKGNLSGSQPLKISHFGDELGKNTTVRLVILNLHNATLRELTSTGQQLTERSAVSGISCGLMNLNARQVFIKRLYHELCAFQPLDTVVTLARQQTISIPLTGRGL
jgi:CHAT domain